MLARARRTLRICNYDRTRRADVGLQTSQAAAGSVACCIIGLHSFSCQLVAIISLSEAMRCVIVRTSNRASWHENEPLSGWPHTYLRICQYLESIVDRSTMSYVN